MARKRELELEAVGLRLRLEQAERDRDRLQSERDLYAEKANTLEWEARAARDQVKDLQEQTQKLAVEKAVLMERLELIAAGIGPEPTPVSNDLPLPAGHEPEEVEDARYALAMGRINHSEFNKILEDFGFSNTEVQIDGTLGYPQY
jgi:hypothetical protein